MNMNKTRKYYCLVATVFAVVSGCSTGNMNFNSMNSSGKTLREYQRNELIAFMPLERMFSDGQARALAKAAGNGKIAEMEGLVSQGVDVDSRGVQDVTPLFWALRMGDIVGFSKLLELGANPNLTFSGSSIMHWSSRIKDTRFLKKALTHGGNPNLKTGEFMNSPLFETIQPGAADNHSAMNILLDAGADIDAKTNTLTFGSQSSGGKTAVMMAADVTLFDIVIKLLNRGARYDLKDVSGWGLKERIAALEGKLPSGSQREKGREQVLQLISEGQ